jgi:O-antigen ligase
MPLFAAVCLVLPVVLALAAGPGVGSFAVASAVGVALGARQPALLAGLLCAAGSADLWPTVDAGGFTFRAGHVWTVALWASALGELGARGLTRFILSRAGITGWLLLLALSAAHLWAGVPNPSKAVGYGLWGAFDVLAMAPAVAFHAHRHPLRVLWAYVGFAVLVALFGLSQFLMPLWHAEPLLVQQWIGGTRPRVNALSYEPSYFAFQAMIPATLLLGLGMAGVLRRGRGWGASAVGAAAVLMVAMALSSSRSAWAGLVLLGLCGLLGLMWNRARHGVWPRDESRRALAAVAGVLVLLWAATPHHAFAGDRIIMERTTNVDDPSSAQPRREGIIEAWRMFQAYPVWGVGPGQFGGTLLREPRFLVRTLLPGRQDADALVTFNLYAELLSESGALGTLCVLTAVGAVAWALWKRRRAPGVRGGLALAVLAPLLVTFGVMYQLNQTLWRAEVWCLLGLCWSQWGMPKAARERA